MSNTYCPIFTAARIINDYSHPFAECDMECAWYDENRDQCALACIAESLDLMECKLKDQTESEPE